MRRRVPVAGEQWFVCVRVHPGHVLRWLQAVCQVVLRSRAGVGGRVSCAWGGRVRGCHGSDGALSEFGKCVHCHGVRVVVEVVRNQ